MIALVDTLSSLGSMLILPALVGFATVVVIDRWLWYKYGAE
jgi:hypothetical protein